MRRHRHSRLSAAAQIFDVHARVCERDRRARRGGATRPTSEMRASERSGVVGQEDGRTRGGEPLKRTNRPSPEDARSAVERQACGPEDSGGGVVGVGIRGLSESSCVLEG